MSPELRFPAVMSAIHYTPAAMRAPSARRFETVVLAVGLCLPVPAFAATGLSMPLPGVVERIAATLVPWADEADVGPGGLEPAPAGTIVRTAGEIASVAAAAPAVAGSEIAPRRPAKKPKPAAEPAKPAPAANPVRPDPAQTAAAPISAHAAPSAAPAAEPAAAPAPAPAPASAPLPPVRARAPEPDTPVRPTEPKPAEPKPAAPEAAPPVPTAPPPSAATPVEEPAAPAPNDAPRVIPVAEQAVEKVQEAIKDPTVVVGAVTSDPVGTVVEPVEGVVPPKKPLLPGSGK